MYFGSVKFFKHLIITIIILAILIPTGICVYLGIQNSAKQKENDNLKAQLSEMTAASGMVYDTPEALFELYKKLEDKEGFLKLISEYDSELYAEFVMSLPAMNEGITAETVTTPSQNSGDEPAEITDSELTETAPVFTTTSAVNPDTAGGGEYESLYPELYCGSTAGITYNSDKDYVYLTFDDGPSKYTDSILYYLDKYKLKATFFVVPDDSEICAQRMKKITDAGHTIGVHSATHDYNKIYADVESYLADFKLCYDRIYKATGVKTELFRFPGGSINDFNEDTRDEIIAEMTRRGFVYFDWNVDSNDAGGADWTEMYVGVLEQISDTNRAVVLMHDRDDRYNTVLVLEDIIKALLDDERGYKIDRLTVKTKPVQF